MSTIITYLVLESSPLTLSFRTGNWPPPKKKNRGKGIFWQMSCKIRAVFVVFHNPEISVLKHSQSRDSGLRKWSGIPGLESLASIYNIGRFSVRRFWRPVSVAVNDIQRIDIMISKAISNDCHRSNKLSSIVDACSCAKHIAVPW